MNLVLPIHVAAGGLALGLGAVALLAKEGGTTHRRSGLLFVYAMLVIPSPPRSWEMWAAA